MDIRVYNTMSCQKEASVPVEAGVVRMYNCGPTVYDQAHIGSMRTHIMADVIRCSFEYLGYEVRQVMNITDVGHLVSDVDDLVERGFEPLAFRYSCLSASYRVPLTFSWESMQRAADGLSRLRASVRRLLGETDGVRGRNLNGGLVSRFRAALADDVDLPGAFAVTWDAVRQANRATEAVAKRGDLDLVLDSDRVLGLSLGKMGEREGALPAEVSCLIEEREAAREARDWQRADSLREAIR